MKILVTGTNSGLGKYIYRKIGTHKYSRKKNINSYKNKKWDLIIHCGYYVGDDPYKNYENIFHSYNLSQLNYKKFIFMSSLIVYEKEKNKSEFSKISLSNKKSVYANNKILCESFYDLSNSLILRLGTLIGKDMRKNNIYKVLHSKKPNVSLNSKSTYTFIDYTEVLDFIKLSLKRDFKGIFNFNRIDKTSLDEIAKTFHKKINYGNHKFNCVIASNKKINKLFNLNILRSIDILKTYR